MHKLAGTGDVIGGGEVGSVGRVNDNRVIYKPKSRAPDYNQFT